MLDHSATVDDNVRFSFHMQDLQGLDYFLVFRVHIQNQEIFNNPGNSGKVSTIPAEFVSLENA